MRRPLLAFAALALLASCAHRALGPDGQPLWLEAESEHFVLRGDVTDAEARDALLQLERVRLGLLTASWHASRQPPAKTHVILLADQLELDDYVLHGVLGFATTDDFEAPLLVSSADHPLEDVRVLQHELAHHVDNAFLLRQPRWLSEGLASYLETIRIAPDGSWARVGEVNQLLAGYFRTPRRLDLRRVMGTGPELYSRPRADIEEFYAQSWALVHYLANQRKAQLDEWLTRLSRAEDPEAAWQKAFGDLTDAQLEESVHDYLVHGVYSMLQMPLPKMTFTVQVRPLAKADLQAEQALLRQVSFGHATPQTAARAAQEAEQALRTDPQSVLAAGIWFATGTRSRDEQLAVARVVAAAHPKDSRGYELLGLSLGAMGGDEEREALETAVRLAPDDARALSHLAFSYLNQHRETDAVVTAHKAVLLAPGNPFYLDGYAVALAAAGRCTEAPAVERRALDMLPDGAAAAAAEHLRLRLATFDQVCSAQQQGTFAGFVAAEPGTTPARTAGACKQASPRIPQSELKANQAVTVEFVVSAEGKAVRLRFKGAPSAPVIKVLTDYLATCPFEPARGPKGAVEWPMTETFTFTAEPKKR